MTISAAFLGPFLGVMIHETLSIYLASLGGTVSELSGVYLIGLEGIMLLGGGIGFITLAVTGNMLLAFLSGFAVSALIGSVTALYAVTLRLNQIIIAIGTILFGAGFSGYLYTEVVGNRTTAFQTQFGLLQNYPIPFLSNVPVLNQIFDQTALGYVVYALIPISWFVLFRTRTGLRLRSVGHNPKSSDILGVSVSRYRIGAVVVGSMLAGVAGFILILGYPPASWSFDFTGGRGIVALALIRVGSWRPQYVFLASLVYGSLASAAFIFPSSLGVPPQFLLMIPYVAGIAMLGLSARLSISTMPAALGVPYSRTE